MVVIFELHQMICHSPFFLQSPQYSSAVFSIVLCIQGGLSVKKTLRTTRALYLEWTPLRSVLSKRRSFEDGLIDEFVKRRYSSFDTEIGKKIRNGNVILEELAEKALEMKKVDNMPSGNQEGLQSIINSVLFK